MIIGSIATGAFGISTAAPARPAVDTDRDRDNDATESAAAKAREAAAPVPTDPNRGRTLDISV